MRSCTQLFCQILSTFLFSLLIKTVNCKPSDVCKEEFKTVFRCRCPASGTFFFCKVRNFISGRIHAT